MSKLTPHVAVVPDSPSVTLANISAVGAAIQKQVTRDFGPVLGIDATVDSFDKLESVPVDYWPVIVRGDIKESGAAGYHTDDNCSHFPWCRQTPAGNSPPARKHWKCSPILLETERLPDLRRRVHRNLYRTSSA
jgi:hypothetical protein